MKNKEDRISLFKRLQSSIRKFNRQDDGGASVEFVLWMPVFVAITMLIVDVTVLLTSQSNYWSVSRDTARLVSRHAMSATEAKTYAEAQASMLWTAPNADVTINGGTVTVSLSAPMTSLSIFNALGFAGTAQVDASVTQAMEPI